MAQQKFCENGDFSCMPYEDIEADDDEIQKCTECDGYKALDKDAIIKMMMDRINEYRANTNRIIKLIRGCQTMEQLNSLKDIPLFENE